MIALARLALAAVLAVLASSLIANAEQLPGDHPYLERAFGIDLPAMKQIIESAGFTCKEAARTFIPPIDPSAVGVECESGYKKRYLFYIKDYGGRVIVWYIDSYVPDSRRR